MAQQSGGPLTGDSKLSSYEPGQEVVPGYTLLNRIGGGMAGDVWVAQAAGGIKVALKVVRSLSMVGGRKELKALKTIRNVQHPNLCPLFGFWTKDAEGRILADGETEELPLDSSLAEPPATGPAPSGSAMGETMSVSSQSTPVGVPAEGGAESGPKTLRAEQLIVVMGLGDCTLYDRLQEVRRLAGVPADSQEIVCGLSAEETLRYLRAAAGAIDLLNQEHQIYHCDIKPQNILLVGGEAQVCDFGLANRFEGDVRRTQHAFATPAYAAPEVLQGQTYSRAVDQYSLAVTYFELRTGVLPFDITTHANMVVAKCTGKLDLSKVTASERKVLHKALHLDPHQRYPSCAAFVRAMAIATGVEKRGGITLKRLAGVAAVVVGLIAGGLFLLKSQSPETYERLMASISPGKSPTELYASACEKFAPFTDPASDRAGAEYVVARDDLRDVIERCQEVFAIASPELQEQVSAKAAQAASVFLDKIGGELDRLGPATSINSSLSSNLVRDLALIAGTYEGNGARPAIVTSDSVARPLRARVDLSRLRLALRSEPSTAGPGGQPLDEWAVDAAERVRTTQTNLPPARRPLAAVAIALTSPLRTATPDFTAEPHLSDLERAEQAAASPAWDDVPAWYRNRWSGLSRQFMPQLEQAYADSGNDEAIRNRIRLGWPDLAFESQLARVQQSMIAGQWQEAAAAFARLEELATSTSNGELLAARADCARLLETLERPEAAAASFRELTERFASGSADPFLANVTEGWMTALADKRLRSASPVDVEQASDAFRSGQRLAAAAGGQLPEALISHLLSAALAAGPTAFDAPEVAAAATAAESAGPTAQFLANCLAAESLVFGQPPSSGFSTRAAGELARKLRDPAGLEPFRDLVPNAYLDYLRGLLALHRGNRGEAVAAWETIRQTEPSADPIPARLGRQRCETICRTYLELATAESGVRDDEVLVQRFVSADGASGRLERARDRVAHARWWVSPFAERLTDELADALAIQELLVDVSRWLTPDRVRQADLSEVRFPARLRQRIAEAMVDPGEGARREDGQLYRASLELAKAFFLRPLAARRPHEVDMRKLLLRSAVAVADIGLGPRLREPEWIEQVLEPAMGALYPLLARSPSEAPALSPEENLQPQLLWRFLTHYLKTDGNSDAEEYFKQADPAGDGGRQEELAERANLSEWYSQLELAAAMLAADETLANSERANLLLKAADFFRRDQDLQEDPIDPSDIEVLGQYVSRAEPLAPQSPAVKVMRAFVLLYRSNLQTEEDARVALLDEGINTLEEAIAPYHSDLPSLADGQQEFSDAQLREALQVAADRLKPSSADLTAVYDAFWCNANLLVKRAFYRAGRTSRLSDLQRAKQCARSAKILLEPQWSLEAGVVKNAAYMVLGNSCEDLAFYCYVGPEYEQEREREFLEAIDAFRQALDYTLTNALKQRIYCSRSILRYVERCSLNREEQRQQLEQAKKTLDQEPDVGRGLRIRWYWLRSRIEEKLGNSEAAQTYAQRGYELATALLGPDVLEEFHQIVIYYSSTLIDSDPERTLELLGEVKSPGRVDYWFMVPLRARALKLLGRPAEIAESVQSAKFAEQGAIGLQVEPNRVAPVLVELARYLQEAAFTAEARGEGSLDTAGAEAAVQRMRDLFNGLMLDPRDHRVAIDCRSLLEAYLVALGDGPLPERSLVASRAAQQAAKSLGTESLQVQQAQLLAFELLSKAVPAVATFRDDPQAARRRLREIRQELEQANPQGDNASGWQVVRRQLKAVQDRANNAGDNGLAQGVELVIALLADAG